MDFMEKFMENAGVMFEDLPAELEAEEAESVMIHEWNGGESDETQ